MKSINDINTNTEEGKLLLAALAKISTESQRDKEPDVILAQVVKLKNDIYDEKVG